MTTDAASAEQPLVWEHIVKRLESNLSVQDVNTYIRSLRATQSNNQFSLWAPNIFISNWLDDTLRDTISLLLEEFSVGETPSLFIGVEKKSQVLKAKRDANAMLPNSQAIHPEGPGLEETADGSNYHFDNFVQGNSNELGLAAAQQVADNPGESYNPLYLYGASGLGKTHLMNAVRNEIKSRQPNARVALINANEYVRHMVSALQSNTIEEFKRFYESLDVLLMDDVHFLADKTRTQEEFFHTFNSLTTKNRQIVLTCDRYPEEISGLEARLQSRFGAGLPIQINPPEIETRVGILMQKAESKGKDLPEETAFFIAKHVQSNVRSLEGALTRVMAHADLRRSVATIDIAKEALRDVVQLRERRVSVDNIMLTVAEYFRITVNDLQSASRRREVTRPRQIAMALTKELTSNSLPDIGKAFGKRDHTTVLHACRAVAKLRREDESIDNNYQTLIRSLRG